MPIDVVISGCLRVPFMLVQVIVLPIFGEHFFGVF
jgi:hypothetical protein